MAKDWVREVLRLLKKGVILYVGAFIVFGIFIMAGLPLLNLDRLDLIRGPEIISFLLSAVILGFLIEKINSYIRS